MGLSDNGVVEMNIGIDNAAYNEHYSTLRCTIDDQSFHSDWTLSPASPSFSVEDDYLSLIYSHNDFLDSMSRCTSQLVVNDRSNSILSSLQEVSSDTTAHHSQLASYSAEVNVNSDFGQLFEPYLEATEESVCNLTQNYHMTAVSDHSRKYNVNYGAPIECFRCVTSTDNSNLYLNNHQVSPSYSQQQKLLEQERSIQQNNHTQQVKQEPVGYCQEFECLQNGNDNKQPSLVKKDAPNVPAIPTSYFQNVTDTIYASPRISSTSPESSHYCAAIPKMYSASMPSQMTPRRSSMHFKTYSSKPQQSNQLHDNPLKITKKMSPPVLSCNVDRSCGVSYVLAIAPQSAHSNGGTHCIIVGQNWVADGNYTVLIANRKVPATLIKEDVLKFVSPSMEAGNHALTVFNNEKRASLTIVFPVTPKSSHAQTERRLYSRRNKTASHTQPITKPERLISMPAVPSCHCKWCSSFRGLGNSTYSCSSTKRYSGTANYRNRPFFSMNHHQDHQGQLTSLPDFSSVLQSPASQTTLREPSIVPANNFEGLDWNHHNTLAVVSSPSPYEQVLPKSVGSTSELPTQNTNAFMHLPAMSAFHRTQVPENPCARQRSTLGSSTKFNPAFAQTNRSNLRRADPSHISFSSPYPTHSNSDSLNFSTARTCTKNEPSQKMHDTNDATPKHERFENRRTYIYQETLSRKNSANNLAHTQYSMVAECSATNDARESLCQPSHMKSGVSHAAASPAVREIVPLKLQAKRSINFHEQPWLSYSSSFCRQSLLTSENRPYNGMVTRDQKVLEHYRALSKRPLEDISWEDFVPKSTLKRIRELTFPGDDPNKCESNDENHAAITIQNAFKRLVNSSKARREYAARAIQKWYRANHRSKRQKEAASLIQAAFRGYRQYIQYKKTREATKTIQKYFRYEGK